MRAALYALGLLYCFFGLAAITACFMAAMEAIARRRVVVPASRGCPAAVAPAWNGTLADISLLALGTCAPQISLALLDALQQLGTNDGGGLGPGTIVGGAAFNLFPILAVCVLVPKKGTVKRIANYGVFVVELLWSLWAYLWLLVILKFSSPNVVTVWEAAVTVLHMPVLMLHAYAEDQRWPYASISTWIDRGGPQAVDLAAGENNVIVASYPSRMDRDRQARKMYRLQAAALLTAADIGEGGGSSPDQLGMHLLRGDSLRSDNVNAAGPLRINSMRSDSLNGDSPELARTSSVGADSDLSLEAEIMRVLEEQRHPTWKEVLSLWKQQVCSAMTVKCQTDESGRPVAAKLLDLVMNPIMFPWKVLFAVAIPPAKVLHGWVAFLFAIAFITGISAVVIELAHLFGCVTGAKDLVIAITILATGTSWPDLVASKIAADHESTADSAIANINASNSINVFVGIGIPWLLTAIYDRVKLHQAYKVPASGLTFSLFTYFGTFIACVLFVFWRRRVLGGELGGPRGWAWVSSFFFLTLWFIFLLLSCLKAYELI
eukprot:SM000012S25310  [mRNA]  locus=s12:228229:231058:- [translate_table: standard]